jgi:hypothetical protein
MEQAQQQQQQQQQQPQLQLVVKHLNDEDELIDDRARTLKHYHFS